MRGALVIALLASACGSEWPGNSETAVQGRCDGECTDLALLTREHARDGWYLYVWLHGNEGWSLVYFWGAGDDPDAWTSAFVLDGPPTSAYFDHPPTLSEAVAFGRTWSVEMLGCELLRDDWIRAIGAAPEGPVGFCE